MKLNEMNAGERGRVSAVGGNAAFQRRITAVGITPSSVFEVVRHEKHFPMLLYVRGTMLAVGADDCAQIETEVL